MKSTVIIPNYNGEEILPKILDRLLEAKDVKENKIVEIMVVDDGSSDNSCKLITSNYPSVKLVKHKVNRGFSSAVNTGARSTKTKYLVLLNSDVVPQKDFLVSVYDNFEKRDLFAVSFNEKNYSYTKGKFEKGYITHEPGVKTDKPHDTFWVSGGSGIFRRDIWMKLGGMDEKLFSPFYWEDVDLSYRAQKRGYTLLWDPRSKVIHEHETTIKRINRKKRERIQERNHLLFIWKNLTSQNLMRKHISGLFLRILKHPGYFLVFLMALAKLRTVESLKKKEFKEGKVSDESIFARFK